MSHKSQERPVYPGPVVRKAFNAALETFEAEASPFGIRRPWTGEQIRTQMDYQATRDSVKRVASGKLRLPEGLAGTPSYEVSHNYAGEKYVFAEPVRTDPVINHLNRRLARYPETFTYLYLQGSNQIFTTEEIRDILVLNSRTHWVNDRAVDDMARKARTELEVYLMFWSLGGRRSDNPDRDWLQAEAAVKSQTGLYIPDQSYEIPDPKGLDRW